LNEATAHLKVSTSELYKTFPPSTSTFIHHKNDTGTRVRQTSALHRATSKLVLELPGVRAAMPRITSAEVALSIAFSVSASPIGGLANSTKTEIKRARARLNDMVSTSDYTNLQPPFSIPSLPVMSPEDDTSTAHREPLHELAMSTGYDGLLQPPASTSLQAGPFVLRHSILQLPGDDIMTLDYNIVQADGTTRAVDPKTMLRLRYDTHPRGFKLPSSYSSVYHPCRADGHEKNMESDICLDKLARA
jgi:hypothetical protein